MKLIALGDIHGRLCWRDIIDKENPDIVVFMGDYVSTHDKNISSEQQCINLSDILDYKENNMDKVILLRGNHDMQHLGYSWAECSGYFYHVYKYMSNLEDRFLSLTQWVYIYDDIVFSHAGITKDFFEYFNMGDPTRDNILKINEHEPSSIFGFTPNRLSDMYGDSPTQPLTWVRPLTLMENHIGWKQVVGHTRLQTPGNILDNIIYEGGPHVIPELWCIDALPYQYLVIEDGVKTMREYEKTI